MRASELIDESALRELESAVHAAERETAGEIVVVVATACDSYASAPWRLGVALAALGFLGLTLFLPQLPAVVYLAAQVAAIALAHLLARIEPVRRFLLPSALVDRCVQERAWRAFRENGLQRTAGATGILLFVALLEHRVVVLGDSGVDRVLDPDERWEDVVEPIVAGLRRGDAVGALRAGVERCGEILARHLPAPPRNPNELPDAIVLED